MYLKALNIMANNTIGYVQDGLVLWLDGIEKGATNGDWVDKINNIRFVNNGKAVSTQYGFDFPSTRDAYLEAESNTLIPYNTGTIEVCYEAGIADTFMILFSSPGIDNLCAGIRTNSGNNVVYASGASGRQGYTISNLFNIRTLSMNSERCIANRQLYPAMTTTSAFSNNANYQMIGARTGYSTGWLYGKIYSIRLYNRILTANEILKNQKFDIERFNLSL